MTLRLRTRAHSRLGNVHFLDQAYSRTRGLSLWETAPMMAAVLDPATYFLYREDFTHSLDTTLDWLQVRDGTVEPALAHVVGGAVRIPTDENDNDEHYLASLTRNWQFAPDKPLWFEARVQLTEANVDDANLLIGLISTVEENTLGDDGAGPPATYDGAVWYKLDGTAVWAFATSQGETPTITSNAGAFVSGVATHVGFIFDPDDGITGLVTPYLNGVALTAHALPLADVGAMHVVFGVKAGGDAVETLECDWVQILAVR